MKNITKVSFLVLLLSIALSGCAEKTKGKTTIINNTTTTPITGGTGGTDTDGDGDIDADDGKVTFYTNLPTLVFSGSGEAGYQYWSSANNLPTEISPNQFRTDRMFAVRIKPVVADGGKSFQGRDCSQWTKNNFSKLQVKLMLSRAEDNGLSTNIKTLTAAVGSYSNTVQFTVPGGTNQPYVLSVHSILSNHRCSAYYGSAPSGCPNAYFDIPVNKTATNPTECVAFELEFATDSSYSAN